MAIYFDWDPTKSATNLREHGVSFETASFVFDDPYRIAEEDSVVDGEVRWRTIGTADDAAVLLVITFEEIFELDMFVRIISARKAVGWERRDYEQNRATDIWGPDKR
jgi:uncharacterized DUF497 family protein